MGSEIEAAQRASNVLAQRLHHEDWNSATLLLRMLELTTLLHPSFARHLLSAGCAGILASCSYDDGPPELVAAALGLQLKVLEADEARNIDSVLLQSEYLLLLIDSIKPSSRGGPRARQSAISLLLLLTKRGRAAKEVLIASGILEVISQELLLDLPSLVSAPLLVKDALATVSLLLEHTSAYRSSSLDLTPELNHSHQPLIADVLEPMLCFHLILSAITQGERDLEGPRQQSLVLIIRGIHAASAGDDVSKELVRVSGSIRSLIRFIISHSPIETPTLSPLSANRGEPRGWPLPQEDEGGSGRNLSGPVSLITPLTRLSIALLLRTTPFQLLSSGHFMAFLLPLILITGNEEGGHASKVARISNSYDDDDGMHSPREGSTILPSRLSLDPLSPLLIASKPLCPVREAVAALKALLSDHTSSQADAVEEGIVPAMAHLLATGDPALTALAAEVISVLASARGDSEPNLPLESSSLVSEVPWHIIASGAVESLTSVLADSADQLHLVTVQRLIRIKQRDSQPGSRRQAGPRLEASISQHFTEVVPSPVMPTVSVALEEGGGARPFVELGRQHLMRKTGGTQTHLDPHHSNLAFPPDLGGSSCMYASSSSGLHHGPFASTPPPCEYCLPSAAMKALLRLAAATSPSTSMAVYTSEMGPSFTERFVSSGGVYILFLLLHHDMSSSSSLSLGSIATSKLTSSLISLLSHILIEGRGWAQDGVRQCNGISILSALIARLNRSGISDIYQLRVSACMAVKAAVEGNSSNRLLAREQDMLPNIFNLLKLSLGTIASSGAPSSYGGAQESLRRDSEMDASVGLLEAGEQASIACMDALCACMHGSEGNQDSLVHLGAFKLVHDLLVKRRNPVGDKGALREDLTLMDASLPCSPAVYAASLRFISAMCECSLLAQMAAMSGVSGTDDVISDLLSVPPPSSVIPSVSIKNQGTWSLLFSIGTAAWYESGTQATGGRDSISESYAWLCYQLLKSGPKGTSKKVLTAAGAMQVLVKVLSRRPAGGAALASSSALMYLLASEADPSLQNEIALNGGGLQAAYDLTAEWQGPVTLSILNLLCYMSQGNMLVKNNARQGGLLPLLLSVVKCCSVLPALDSPSSPVSSEAYAWTPTAVLAARALTCLVQSCHESQDEVAGQGGVEMLVQLMSATINSASETHQSILLAKANGASALPPLPSLSVRTSRDGVESSSSSAASIVSIDGRTGVSSGSHMVGLAGQGTRRASSIAGSLSFAGSRGGRGPSFSSMPLNHPGHEKARESELNYKASVECDLLEALVSLLSSLVKFNSVVLERVKETHCLDLILEFLEHETSILEEATAFISSNHPPTATVKILMQRWRGMKAAVRSACSCISHLVSPEDESIESSLFPLDLGRTLVRLMTLAEEPDLVLEASRAIEHLALVANDVVFEEEVFSAMISILHTRGRASLRAAAKQQWGKRPGVKPSVGGSASALVQEASQVLTLILQHSDPSKHLETSRGEPKPLSWRSQFGLPLANGAKGTLAVTSQGKAAPLEPSNEPKMPLPSTLQPLPPTFATHLPADSGTYSPSVRPSKSREEGRSSIFSTSPTKHQSPPPMSLEGPLRDDPRQTSRPSSNNTWQSTAAKEAPLLQSSVSTLLSDDLTWQPVKLQVAWSLLLLCLKRPENREFGLRLQRTKLTPLTLQLENAATSQAAIARAKDGKFSKSALQALNKGSSPTTLVSPLSLFRGVGPRGGESLGSRGVSLSPSSSIELPVSTSARSSGGAGDAGGPGVRGSYPSPAKPFYNPHLTPGGLITQAMAPFMSGGGPATPSSPPFVVPFDAPGWSGRKYQGGGMDGGVVFTLSPFPNNRERGDPSPGSLNPLGQPPGSLNPLGQTTPSEPDSPTLHQSAGTDGSTSGRRTALSDDDDDEMAMIRKEVALLEASGLSPLRPALPQAPSSATKHSRNASSSSASLTSFSPARRLGF